jgi:hypothetical protein
MPSNNCTAANCIRDALPPCMLARVECCLLFLATLSSVAAFYPATGALNTQPLVLCDSLDADVASLLAATTPAFPGSLAESQNYRGLPSLGLRNF